MRDRLTSKTGIRESLREGGPFVLRDTHSMRSYKRFFEGYIEENISEDSGKGVKIRRVYTGKYYAPDQSAHKWSATKLYYSLLFVAATLLFINAATRDTGLLYSETAYMVTIIPQPICVFFVIWCLMAMVNLLMAPEKMTIGEYKRSTKSLHTGTKCYALALLLSTVGELVQLLCFVSDRRVLMLLSAAEFLLAAALVYILYRANNNLKYFEIDNPNEIAAGGQSAGCTGPT